MGKYQAYPEYIDAESKWLDMLPAKWKRAPLKHLVAVRITDGPHETPDFVDDGVPFLSAEAVKNNTLDFTKKRGYITRELHEFYSKKCLPQLDDVFMIKSGNTTGNIAIVETTEEFNIWSPLALIRANRQKVLPRFVYYAMRADYFRTSVELSWSQGTQPNIGMAVIENLHIPFGTLEEQQGIANFLDHETVKIDTLIEQQQQLIQLLKEKRQAVISHAVTKGLNPDAPMKDSGVEWLGEVPAHWTLTRLKYEAALNPKAATVDLSPSLECNFVPMEKLKTDYLLLDEVRTVDEVYSGYTCFCNGDVLMAKVTPCFENKNIAVASDLRNGVGFGSTEIYVLRAKPSIDKRFLFYRLQENEFMDIATAAMTGAGGLKRVPSDVVNNFQFALPPLDEQKAICEFLENQKERFTILDSFAQRQVVLLQERRTALISAAVTGKIDVRNWQAPQQ